MPNIRAGTHCSLSRLSTMASLVVAPVARIAAPVVSKQRQGTSTTGRKIGIARTTSVNGRGCASLALPAVDANAIVQLADGLEDSIPTIAVVASVVSSLHLKTWRDLTANLIVTRLLESLVTRGWSTDSPRSSS